MRILFILLVLSVILVSGARAQTHPMDNTLRDTTAATGTAWRADSIGPTKVYKMVQVLNYGSFDIRVAKDLDTNRSVVIPAGQQKTFPLLYWTTKIRIKAIGGTSRCHVISDYERP